ncbi:MAG: dihydroxy-acid/6-phosphogluconate dehydratase [Benjaminiella poitrasii]|nr:MAG: dihydroxy-acid/6-phosphogluconate dehydratase [Benjaminiella poitrasii]
MASRDRKEGMEFTSIARVFDEEDGIFDAMERKDIPKGSVVIVRHQEPNGDPGIPEVIIASPPFFLLLLEVNNTHYILILLNSVLNGFIIGYVCPEAQVGGPIALVLNGDEITINANT